MDSIEELVRECIYDTPLALLSINQPELIKIINEYLPYSTGFEIECNQLPVFDVNDFRNIPNIIEVNCDISEQRFRIPNGIAGFICLYNICEQLKINSELNYGSGIHYHCDMTNIPKSVTSRLVVEHMSYIENELESWNYKGSYNHRGSSWVRANGLGTVEYRVGEMSFDYKLLVTRIIHANKITKYLKDKVDFNKHIIYEEIDRRAILKYISTVKSKNLGKLSRLNDEIKKLKAELPEETTEDISAIIQNRVTRL